MNPTRTLLIGGTGTGKTTQFGTMPGRKFAYVFDPTGITALARWPEIEIAPFMPTFDELEMGAHSVTKKVGGTLTQYRDEPLSPKGPPLYPRWLEDVKRRAREGFFETVDSLLVDSLTLLSVAVLDRVQWHQLRIKSEFAQSDYRIAGNRITNVLRGLTSLPCNLLLTAHTKFAKDDATAKSWYRVTLPGGAREFVPRFMDNIFVCRVLNQGEKVPPSYNVQTRPDRDYPDVRTAIDGLKLHEDVTIDFGHEALLQGLGKLLAKGTPR